MKTLATCLALGLAAGVTLTSVAWSAEAGKAHEAMMSDMQKMMTQMKMPSSGDPDQDFAAMMKLHHQGAIDMANTELKYGKDDHLRAMAEEMVKMQAKEIKDLESWQGAHKN